jgi:copper chaperone CopZ
MTVRWSNLWADPESQILSDEPLDDRPELRKMTYRTMGIMCMHCAERMQAALEEIDGVVSARVDHEADRTEVLYEGNHLDPELPEETVQDAAVLRWARKLLAAAAGQVHAKDHDDACGIRPGPGIPR